jgi:hypothetical protein
MEADIPEYASVEEFFVAKALNLIKPYKTYKIGDEYGFVNLENNFYTLHTSRGADKVTKELCDVDYR